jgi:hypothetical protein
VPTRSVWGTLNQNCHNQTYQLINQLEWHFCQYMASSVTHQCLEARTAWNSLSHNMYLLLFNSLLKSIVGRFSVTALTPKPLFGLSSSMVSLGSQRINGLFNKHSLSTCEQEHFLPYIWWQTLTYFQNVVSIKPRWRDNVQNNSNSFKLQRHWEPLVRLGIKTETRCHNNINKFYRQQFSECWKISKL